MTGVQHDAPTIYSSSAVESEMEDCFLLNNETKQFPKKNAAPLVLFQSSTLPSQSASVNAFKTKSCIFVNITKTLKLKQTLCCDLRVHWIR